MPVLPFALRQRMVNALAAGCIEDSLARRIASAPQVSAAALTHAFTLARETEAGRSPKEFAAAVESTLDSVLTAQRSTSLPKRSASEGFYDLQSVRTDIPVADLVERLKGYPHARLCFHGLPGTGKTETARHIAEQCGRSLVEVRASDLLGGLVGQTERAIAETFRGIDPDSEALLIDEIDGLLHDRESARESWEITQVNELLVSLERFEGLLFLTTNRPDALDAATRRRVDLHVEFLPLCADRLWRLLNLYVARAGIPAPDPELRTLLGGIDQATPGDLSQLARRHRFSPLPSARHWIEALARESIAKKRRNRGAIGFHAAFRTQSGRTPEESGR